MSFINFSSPEFYLVAVIAVLNSFVLLGASYKFFQVVQLYGYKLSGFYKWEKQTRFKNFTSLLFLSILSFGGIIVFNVVFSAFNISKYYSYISLIFYFSLGIIFFKNILGESKKTPLKETKRMQRMHVMFALIAFVASYFVILFPVFLTKYLRFGLVAFTPLLLYIIFPIAFYLELPIEKLIQVFYISKAKRKLKKLEQVKPKIKIGITGSFGKTSTKMILASILSEKFKVSFSPASFNTPMGLTKYILKNVNADDEILIAEMGARNVGDIKKLCKIICPDIAVITSIGVQHLESFKTIENIAKTKLEIVEFSKPNAKIFVGDDENLEKVYSQIKKPKFMVSGEKNKNSFAFVSGHEVSDHGSVFDLNIDGKIIHLKTKLLGDANIKNIALAASIAFSLGMTEKEIEKGVEKQLSIAHRLEMIKSPNGVIVLDDSYNASPVGTKIALATLAKFKNKTKWVMTPGLIEQGKNQKNANFEFGCEIAKVADGVIVVNRVNRKDILGGLEHAGFDKSKIYCAESLEEGKKIIAEKVKEGSVLLIENDLPDNFV